LLGGLFSIKSKKPYRKPQAGLSIKETKFGVKKKGGKDVPAKKFLKSHKREFHFFQKEKLPGAHKKKASAKPCFTDAPFFNPAKKTKDTY